MKPRHTAIATAALLFACVTWAEPLRTFTIQERFGVNHPDQIIDFDVEPPLARTDLHLLGPDGPVAFQLLEDGGKLAVRADLPAGETRAWQLLSGSAAELTDTAAVSVVEHETVYEIANERIAIRVPRGLDGFDAPPAPIQGLRYPDGTWTATGPNTLDLLGPGWNRPGHSTTVTSMDVHFLERGPLKTVVRIVYHTERAALTYSTTTYADAGPGHYTATLTVQAGQPSVLIEEESDTDVGYTLDVNHGLQANQARYQGHHAQSLELGRDADGRQYRPSHERRNMDAFVDFAFDAPRAYRSMAQWDPWVYNSGWYWQLYRDGAEQGNLFGIFASRASRVLGPGNSGVAVHTAPAGQTGEPVAGITLTIRRLKPTLHADLLVRFQWGLFLGRIEEDLGPPDQPQAIARQMNLHGGFNLNKVHRYQVDYPDPPQGHGALFMSAEAMADLLARLRADDAGPHGKGVHGYLYRTEPYARPLVDFWRNNDAAEAGRLAGQVADTARDILDRLVNGHGIHDIGIHYWHGAGRMTGQALWADQLLATDHLSAEDRAAMKAAVALFGYLLWDDDFVPMQPASKLNLGNPNMPVMQRNARSALALQLASQPDMAEFVRQVVDQARRDLISTVNEHGAHIGSAHYIGASMLPLLNTFQQLQTVGVYDGFAGEERLAAFAEYYLQLLTPPEVRFGGWRKLAPIGDGSTESSTMYGQMATGFASSRPDLSRRLMGAWTANHRRHGNFQGSTLLKIDERLPESDFPLRDATFPGWFSVLRHGWGTPDETAAWVVNGEWYSDHRHADQGSVVLYALGAPLSTDWGSIYYPRAAGGFMHNMVWPADAIGHPWDAPNPPLDAGHWRYWLDSTQERFVSFTHGARAVSRFQHRDRLTWRRELTLIRPDSARPAIIIRDRFDGPDAEADKVFTLNLMATGAVQTPAGPMTPEERTHPRTSATTAPDQLPSAGAVFALPTGLNRLGFTGQWLIDWDLYVLADAPQQAHIGNWGHLWHPTPEEEQFRRANHVERFEERQHILRVKGDGPFAVIILPYRKGEPREGVHVTREGDAIRIADADSTTVIGPHHFWFEAGPERRTLATFSDEPADGAGLRIEGGPAEVNLDGTSGRIILHGDAGPRTITLGQGWRSVEHAADAPAFAIEDGVVRGEFPGGEALTLTLIPR